MVNVRVWFPVPPSLLAESVIVLVPGIVGVPEITPVIGSRLNPAGRSEAPKAVGMWVAVMEWPTLFGHPLQPTT